MIFYYYAYARLKPFLRGISGLPLQLCVLISIIIFNKGQDAPLTAIAATFTTGILCQYLGCRWAGIRPVFLSAMITCCSLTLLLRTPGPEEAALCAALAIFSKFILRLPFGHVFNPANIAVCIALFVDIGWISPGRLGGGVEIAVALGILGLLINAKVGRYDMGLFFMLGLVAAQFARAFVFGDPPAVPLHALQNVTAPLFAFFMLPDPATTPRNRTGRLYFAMFVLCLGLYLQWEWYVVGAFIYALAAACALRGGYLLVSEICSSFGARLPFARA